MGGLHTGAHDARSELRPLHQRRAFTLADYLSGRACHVDIDEGQAIAHTSLDGLDGAGELVRLGSEELDADLGLFVGGKNELPCLLAGIGEPGD